MYKRQIEAGLGWITKFAEGKNFINRPMLEKQKAEGTVRKLVGFEMVEDVYKRQRLLNSYFPPITPPAIAAITPNVMLKIGRASCRERV